MGHRRTGDHFTRRAQKAGYAARSVFKLQEIDKKHRLTRNGQRVLDLGCAPGSWLKYIAKKIGPRGRVIGIDRTEIQPVAANAQALVGDIFEYPLEEIRDAAGGELDLITSDMAPDTCGNRFTDHVRSVALCERALQLAVQLLKPGGHFVCKVFEGPDLQGFVQEMKLAFKQVKRMKPKSTRSESVELFIIGLSKRGTTPTSQANDHE